MTIVYAKTLIPTDFRMQALKCFGRILKAICAGLTVVGEALRGGEPPEVRLLTVMLEQHKLTDRGKLSGQFSTPPLAHASLVGNQPISMVLQEQNASCV
jgi:hypothetical protein